MTDRDSTGSHGTQPALRCVYLCATSFVMARINNKVGILGVGNWEVRLVTRYSSYRIIGTLNTRVV